MSDCPSVASGRFASPKPSWSAVGRLIRLHSQTGTWLLLLPTMWSLVLAAGGVPPLHLILTFAVGSFLMRSAGVIMNDLADRSFDRQVARTQSRPLASGELRVTQGLLVAALLLAAAGGLVLFLNPLTILLSPIALALAALYPFAKRVVHLPQGVLGIAFGWGTIMAWTASRGTLDAPVWYIFAATICWAIGYDTIYAIQDLEDDRRIGVKSSAILFGSYRWVAVGVCFFGTLTFLVIAGILSGVGSLFFVALTAAGGFFAQQVRELYGGITTQRASAMFTQHVWIGWVILLGAVLNFA